MAVGESKSTMRSTYSFNTTSSNTLQLVGNKALYKSAIYSRIDGHIDHDALSAIKLKTILQICVLIVYRKHYITELI